MVFKQRSLIKSIFSRRENWIFIPVVIIILLLLFYSIYSVYLSTPSRSQLSIYSDNWHDLSDCRNDIQSQGYKISSIISTPTILSKLNDSKNKIYMAIGVERPYTTDEARVIWDFVHDGGNLIIADDFGFGNSLWDKAPGNAIADIEFENKQLFDPSYIKNTKFVNVNATFNLNHYNLLLNEPSALKRKYSEYYDYYNVRSVVTQIASSTDKSWIDSNENGVRDPEERPGEYDVIVYIMGHSREKSVGKVVVVSDPGLFINDNWKMLDNARFVQALIRDLLPNGGEVIFDEGRHINENTFENSRHVIYSGLVYITSSVWSIIIIASLIISSTIIISAKIKSPPQWKNNNLLKVKLLNVLNYPYVGAHDYWQMYSTFLEKVRLGYGFSLDEFRSLDQNTLCKLINDQYLWSFVSQRLPAFADNNYYTFITRQILDWTPYHPEHAAEIDKTSSPVDGQEYSNEYEEYFEAKPDEYTANIEQNSARPKQEPVYPYSNNIRPTTISSPSGPESPGFKKKPIKKFVSELDGDYYYRRVS